MGKDFVLDKKGLTGSYLKWIAIVTMFIDHIGAFLIEPYLLKQGIFPGITFLGPAELMANTYNILLQVNTILRLIGRFAFPIFAFLLVEGFLHTRNLKRYILQMGIFALVSEIPFDLAGSGTLIEYSHQNIFFTLFTGLLCISIYHRLDGISNMRWVVLLVAMFLSSFFRFDYGAMGVLLIFIFYHFHDDFKLRNLFSAVVLLQQLTAVLSLFLIQLYNGKRGKQNKYFFYMFYPVHLMLFFLLRQFIFN